MLSRRAWKQLIAHDRRLVGACKDFDNAAGRFRASRHSVTGAAQTEFRIEVMEALRNLRSALIQLREFQDRVTEREFR